MRGTGHLPRPSVARPPAKLRAWCRTWESPRSRTARAASASDACSLRGVSGTLPSSCVFWLRGSRRRNPSRRSSCTTHMASRRRCAQGLTGISSPASFWCARSTGILRSRCPLRRSPHQGRRAGRHLEGCRVTAGGRYTSYRARSAGRARFAFFPATVITDTRRLPPFRLMPAASRPGRA